MKKEKIERLISSYIQKTFEAGKYSQGGFKKNDDYLVSKQYTKDLKEMNYIFQRFIKDLSKIIKI